LSKYKKIIVAILIVIEFCMIFLTYKSFSNKEIVELKDVNVINKNNFSMYIENTETGKYSLYEDSYFPSGYTLNVDESICVGLNGEELSNILKYNDGKVTVTSDKTAYCYLYFDKVKPSLSETVIAIAGEEPDENTGVYQVFHTNGGGPMSLNASTKFERLSEDGYVNVSNDYYYFNGDRWYCDVGNDATECHYVEFGVAEAGIYQLTFYTKIASNEYASYTTTGTGPAYGTIHYNFGDQFDYVSGYGQSNQESKTVLFKLNAGDTFYINTGTYSWDVYFYLEKAMSNDYWGVTQSADAGYRYHENTGYVTFNEELWQIVSVENGSEIGLTSGEYYTKIIKKQSIGSLAYDTNSGVDWSTSSLYNTLNGDYYNKSGLYSETGLSNEARGMVAKANWYYSSVDSNAYWLNEFFIRERMNKSKVVNNYVGIMYPTDAPYNAAIPELGSCATISLSSIASTCMTGFIPYNNMWLITPGNTGAYQYDNVGDVKETSTNTKLAVYPTVYLDSSVQISGGTGSSNDPWIIMKG